MVGWQPRHGHVTQLHPDGSGWNDCWAASLARYLFEDQKVAENTDPFTVINAIDEAARSEPDSPDNPATTLYEASASLQHYALPSIWTASFQEMLASPWAICLVDGTALRPSQYPAGWFSDPGQGNHFILSVPNWNGAVNWFNDPLVPAGVDVQYDLASVASAFYGAFLLPLVPGEPVAITTWKARRAFGLLVLPRHGVTCVWRVLAGQGGVDYGQRSTDPHGQVWGRLGFGIHGTFYVGWAPVEYLTEPGG